MRTSIALISAALLLGAALARPSADVPRPSPPLRPPATALPPEISPDATSFLDTIIGALLPPVPPEPALIGELIRLGSRLAPEDDDPTIEAIQRKLDTMLIDLAFERTPYEDVLAYIRDYSGLHLILDASTVDRIRIDPPITVHLKSFPLRLAIRRVLEEISPFWDFTVTEEKVVLITSNLPGRPITDPVPIRTEPLAGFAAVIEATWVDLDVQNWPLSAIVEELRARTGLDIRLRREEEGNISFKAVRLNLTQALMNLLLPRNLLFEIEGVTIWIGSADRY